jgi:predicted patatin/cPLA2 family phospholipase
MLPHLLSQDSYALCLTPGFFRFYSEIGILEALDESGFLKVSHVTGSSAGALVGAFLAAGLKPSEMAERVLPIERTSVWDIGGLGGLLKGEAFEALIEKDLPVKTFEEALIPACVTAFDLSRMKTRKISSGSIAKAVRASCTFPGLFQPCMIEGSPHIDGGVWDHVGMMGLEDCFALDQKRKRIQKDKEEGQEKEAETKVSQDKGLNLTNKLVVNVVYSTPSGSSLPKSLEKCRVSFISLFFLFLILSSLSLSY